MKKILLFACGLFIFAAASQAQTADTSGKTRHRMEHRRGGNMMGPGSALAKKLNLTADQQTKLKAINADFKKQGEAIKANSELSDDQKKTAFRDLFKKNREAQNAIYTDEQKEIIKKEMQQRRQERGNRKGNRPGSKRGQQ